MAKYTLQEYLKTSTQARVAEAAGITQGAVSQMLISGRDIRITTDTNGDITEVYEVRPMRKKTA